MPSLVAQDLAPAASAVSGEFFRSTTIDGQSATLAMARKPQDAANRRMTDGDGRLQRILSKLAIDGRVWLQELPLMFRVRHITLLAAG